MKGQERSGGARRDGTLARVRYLLREERPWRWVAVIVLALVVTGVEAVGAAAIFLLLALVSAPDAPVTIPFVGELSAIQGSIPQDRFVAGLAAFVAAFFVVRGVVVLTQLYVQDRLAHNAGARLAARVHSAYLAMPYVLHVRRNSAELIRNAYESVRSLTGDLLLPGVRLIANAVLALGLFAVLVVVAPLASVLAIGILLPVVVLLLRLIQPRLKLLGKRRQRLSKESLQVLQQSLHGLREVTLFGRADYFRTQFRRHQHALARVSYRNRVFQEIPRLLIETVLVGFIAGFLIISVVVRDDPDQVLAVLGLFAYVALRLQPTIQKIVQSLNSIRFAGAAIDNIYEDLALVEGATVASDAETQIPGPGRIELDDVWFHYVAGGAAALRGVDLVIEPGESIGIVGPTGGGKSTLVDVLTGLLTPTSGQMSVDGIPLERCGTAWRARIGVVPQQVFLLDDTLRANVAFGVPDADIDDERVTEALRLAQLTGLVAELPEGVATRVGERGVRLSGGQRQRLAIARALYRDPQVVIFDEGTSALDNATEADLLAALASLRGHRTLIAVAHRLTTVRDCDRIVVVANGDIADVGSYDELLLRNPMFARLTTSGTVSGPDQV